MLHITKKEEEIKEKNYNSLYTLFNIKETQSKPIAIKKSLSLDNFWPNTPPNSLPNESFLHSIQTFLKNKYSQMERQY
tara:strand:- start:41 stop:274 length:234 start_codon:yes stop_codon:yes gene_type:complete